MGAYAPLVINVGKAIIFLVFGYIAAGMVARFIRKRIAPLESLTIPWAILPPQWRAGSSLSLSSSLFCNCSVFRPPALLPFLGAASLAIGLALQGTLSDVASGVMLIVFRPYKLGDYVDIAGTAGTVKSIDLFVTQMVTPDNVQIIMPNSKAWGSIITNYSCNETRRVDLTYGIDYSNDADKAMALILEIANADERVKKDPEPWIALTNLGDSSVDITTPSLV